MLYFRNEDAGRNVRKTVKSQFFIARWLANEAKEDSSATKKYSISTMFDDNGKASGLSRREQVMRLHCAISISQKTAYNSIYGECTAFEAGISRRAIV